MHNIQFPNIPNGKKVRSRAEMLTAHLWTLCMAVDTSEGSDEERERETAREPFRFHLINI